MNRLLIFVLMLAFAATASGAELVNPWVSTDQTVDCSSYETIIRDLKLKEMKTDEERALALYNFFRQRVYHFANMPESRDPIKCINVIGNTLCGSQGTCMKGLLNAAGIKARVVCGPGHTFYEAFYDDKWHGFDTFMNFYVFTRGDKRNVASFDELKADPTLSSKAVEEGRAVPGYLHCGDTDACFVKGIQVLNYEPMKLPWKVNEFKLRSGEELVRSWGQEGKPQPGSLGGRKSPHHTCGTRDRRAEPYLFKFWEPYGIPKYEAVTVSYRHYFNGRINYAPDLTSDKYKDAVVSEKGVKASPEGLTGEGEVVFSVNSPFYICDSEVVFETAAPADTDVVEVAASEDGKQWTPVAVTKDPATSRFKGSLNATVVKGPVGLHAYQVKFTLKGKVALKRFHLGTVYTHNAMSAPHLMPGKNKVTVTVANADALKASPLTVAYRYKDAPATAAEKALDATAWAGEIKTVSKVVDSSPFSFEVELPVTAKLPQMQDLTLRNGELAWRP
jgi:hypothetical protein